MIDERSTTGTAAVIGAGTMGGGIAAQLANAGWRAMLLDVPGDAERNGPARAGLERVRQARPPLLFLPELADWIEIGNTADNPEWLRGADWFVEAVAERMEVKQAVMAQIEAHAGPKAVISSNTSGLSLREMARGRSFQSRFLGSHFLNPPRYLKLLEVIPLPETEPQVAAGFVRFAEQVLGHRVVIAKDTPGFISTRIWIQHLVYTMRLAEAEGVTFEEADLFTGPLLGRPRSATFRMADIVGLDIVAAIAANQRAALTDDPFRDTLQLPASVQQMILSGRLGDKSGGGFYQRRGKTILTLDPRGSAYRERIDVRVPEIDALMRLPLAERLPVIATNRGTKWGRFINALLDNLRDYTNYAGPIVANDVLSVDNVMRWGFQWELGPFELEDLRSGEARSYRVIDGVRQMRVLAARATGVEFAIGGSVVSDKSRESTVSTLPDQTNVPAHPLTPSPHHPITSAPEYASFVDYAAAGPPILKSEAGALLDLCDGVAGLRVGTKLGTFSPPLCDLIKRALEAAQRDFVALVIGSDGPHFSAGYDLRLLLDAALAQDWAGMDSMLRQVQDTNQALKFAPIPVVAAVRGYTLGAGCECAMHCAAIQAGPELAMGLPELSAGLVPAGGGIVELLNRAMIGYALYRSEVVAGERAVAVFGKIAENPVSDSAAEARKFDLLRSSDGISRNADRLLFDAKQRALKAAQSGRVAPRSSRTVGRAEPPPDERLVQTPGPPARRRLEARIAELCESGRYTEYDARIAREIAGVITGEGAADDPDPEAEVRPVPARAILALERAGSARHAPGPGSRGRTSSRPS